MKLRIISVGTKCPAWVRQGFDEYAKRMPREMPLSLQEIPAPRHHQDSNKIDEVEGKKIAEKDRCWRLGCSARRAGQIL